MKNQVNDTNNFIINYINDETLNPVLSIPKALFFFIIGAHYLNLIIIPYLLSYLVTILELYKFVSKSLLILISLSLSYSMLFFLFLYFFSAFYKTIAITNWKVLEKEFLIDIMVKMIKKKIFFLILHSLFYINFLPTSFGIY
jgi:hypothetical protein